MVTLSYIALISRMTYNIKKRLFEKTARAIKSYFFQYTAHASYNGRLYGGSYVDCQCHLSSQRKCH